MQGDLVSLFPKEQSSRKLVPEDDRVKLVDGQRRRKITETAIRGNWHFSEAEIVDAPKPSRENRVKAVLFRRETLNSGKFAHARLPSGRAT